MKIAFITDLHIDKAGVNTFGIDTRPRLNKVINHLKSTIYDLIILGGDLHHRTGDKDTYQWVKSQFAALHIPTLVIAGNHDNATEIAEVFELNHHQGNLYYSYLTKNFELLCLDTSSGAMDEPQWVWLQDKLNNAGKKVLIFMHHPPIVSGSKHMEPKYLFTQSNRFKALCNQYPDKHFYVFTGHYHLERTIIDGNITVFITPATSVQIHPDREEFSPIVDIIGYREIELVSDEVIYTNTVVIPVK